MHRFHFWSPGDVNTRNGGAKSREKSAEHIIISVTDSKQFNHPSADGEAVNRRNAIIIFTRIFEPLAITSIRVLRPLAKWCHEYESFERKKKWCRDQTSSTRFRKKGVYINTDRVRLESSKRRFRATGEPVQLTSCEARSTNQSTSETLKYYSLWMEGGGRGRGGEGTSKHLNIWFRISLDVIRQ